MAQVTIKEFAQMHGVTPRAIRFAIEANGWEVKNKYGLMTIDSRIKYPARKRGRPKGR